MTQELVVNFEKRFPGGPTIEAEFRHPIDPKSVSVLFGPSGCGKTTVLRCLAGLERPERGTIRWSDQVWFDQQRRIRLAPQRRGIGYLFQEYSLFPHMTVVANLEYALGSLRPAERRQRVDEMLDRFDLQPLRQRFPHQVSGGQQQRIALARTLACRPRLLLLDEPLSALDSVMRDHLRGELRRLLAESGTPTIMVTHDRTEAIALADQVLVLHEGTIRQAGPPDEVFSRPVDLAVAQIVGVETVAPARITSREQGLARIEIQGCNLLAVAPNDPAANVFACIRAEDVVLQKQPAKATSAQNRLDAVVQTLVPEGPLIRVTLNCGFTLMALVTRTACQELDLKTGDRVKALIKVPAVHLLPRS